MLRLKTENPRALLSALDAITESEIAHARRALATGASGVLLSVANANAAELSTEDYVKFSQPFDRRILEATREARLNILHLHVEPAYLGLFEGFPAPVINYSLHVSGIPITDVRRRYRSAIAGGIDEVNYRKLTASDIEAQWKSAQKAAGGKFMLTPGCSVPNDCTTEELERMEMDETLTKLLEQMKMMSADELQDQVHRRFEYKLCRACQRSFLVNPLGKPRGQKIGEN